MYLRNAYTISTHGWQPLTRGQLKTIIRSLEIYNNTSLETTITVAMFTGDRVAEQYSAQEVFLAPGNSAVLWGGLQKSLPLGHEIRVRGSVNGVRVVVNIVEL